MTQTKRPPEIHISSQVWNKILNQAKRFSGIPGDEKAYALFGKRRKKGKAPRGYLSHHYEIIKMKSIQLEHDKQTPDVYRYVRQKERGMYPAEGKRYVGAVEIRNDLDIHPLDGYWVGREKIDLNIYVNAKGEHKAFWVDHKWGKFYETQIRIC